MAVRFFRFRRFSSQLLLLLAGLIAVVQVTVYLLVSGANERNAVEQIDENLRSGAKLFRQNLGERIDFLTGSAKIMSNDYAIKPLLMQDPVDRDTLRSTLLSYVQRVKDAPIIALFSTEGDLLASTDEVVGEGKTGPFRALIHQAHDADAEQASGYSYLGDQLHVLVVVPLYAPFPSVAAWFGLAFPIDTAFANKIKSTTRLDVTFTSNPDRPDLRVLSTTLSPAMAAAVTRHTAPSQTGTFGSELIDLDGEPFVTLFEPLLLLGEAPARIALQRSLDAELAPAEELKQAVLTISLVALFSSTLAALYLARGVSEPVRQLADYTKLVATGNYTQRVDLTRDDELGQLATAFNQMTAGLAERDKVRDLLGKVVSPEIATQLLHSGVQLGGEEREVTILFCDLRNFTGLSESMPPTAMLALLNRYLDRMSAIIEKHGGVIDKYIGDAIMALFGAPLADPEAPGKAIAAAREMAQALDLLNRELGLEGKPALAFGIGINTARVVAGNMGSKTRLNYTVIGDGVNLASRLEGLTKEAAYGTVIIVSEGTLKAMQNPPPTRPLGEVTVKGKTEAVKIFALSAKGESQPPYAV